MTLFTETCRPCSSTSVIHKSKFTALSQASVACWYSFESCARKRRLVKARVLEGIRQRSQGSREAQRACFHEQILLKKVVKTKVVRPVDRLQQFAIVLHRATRTVLPQTMVWCIGERIGSKLLSWIAMVPYQDTFFLLKNLRYN